ncbi:mechanosensitive ion channel family protein [Rugosimonospora africana]|uniref:MscS Mechanosensitive ion channel n=1 Tax=Rugosimonospora africana TaxID=556532 RepID=A0A8J3QT28_9ACTN|nr:mechanosensitive ion channel family protein [Rugosimonospora africana]GIH16308.1 MscS Mechanosensitive ion channel [Rugosimonospora africana]
MYEGLAPLTDAGLWARSSGLEIVLYVTGAVLLTRFVTWLSRRITGRIDAESSGGDTVVTEDAKHRHAVIQVVAWAFLVLVYSVTAVLVLQRLGIPLSGIVAPATVLGVALGFGAQRIVQDILAGFFVVTERQYGFGDLVRLNVPGTITPLTGTVEEVTLRMTRIRTINGEVVTTPNGQIIQVVNLSRDWARAVVDVPIPATADVTRVSALLVDVGNEMYREDERHNLLLDPPTVMGVESLDIDQLKIRVVARTLPGKQFDIGRMLRARITSTLRREGINVPADVNTVPATATAAGPS